MRELTAEFFARDTLTVARELIGVELSVGRCAGRIVETEAYTDDAASHSVTRRHQAQLMHNTFGHLYVYFIYGMVWCLNFTTERDGVGAVLIRALEPLRGVPLMHERRGTDDRRLLTSGPGRLCQALAIDGSFNGRPLGQGLKLRAGEHDLPVACGPRIGISRATDLPWRFYAVGNPFVSRGARKPRRGG